MHIRQHRRLVIVFAGVLIMGLALIARAIISLLRSFTRPPVSPRGCIAAVALAGRRLPRWVWARPCWGQRGRANRPAAFDVAPETSVLVGLGTGLVVALIALILLVYWPSRGEVKKGPPRF